MESAPLHLREMAALFLRRMLILQERSVFLDLSPEAQIALKSALLHLVQVRARQRNLARKPRFTS